MRYGSVCSGIEAATVAWHPLGWEPAFFSEIETFPRAVLRHRWPGVPLHGDFTTIGADDYGPIDLLVGGTPCQSFSVAGLRRGLDDKRGNLALEYLRLADRLRPRWVVWENVPGVFSSVSHTAPALVPPPDPVDMGRDGQEVETVDDYDADEFHAFECFLAGLQQLGYGFAWRVLDAQYCRVEQHPCAVPQRRRRVFVVGYLGDWRCAAAVLSERESLRGHPPPRREAGQGTAPTLAARTRGGGGLGTDFDCDGGLIALALRGERFDASEDGTGRGAAMPVAFDLNQITSATNRSRPDPAVHHMLPATACPPHLATPCAVRRLTPRECERLMGYPDDYTAIPYRGKPADLCPDGPRYKALGNSMAVNIMRWLGLRIQAVEGITQQQRTAAE